MKNKLRFIPPDYIIAFIGLQILLNYFVPIIRIIFFPYTYLGIPLILLGLYLNLIWVANTFEKEKTTTRPHEKPSKLVLYGPFKYTRNPTYLGMVFTLVGFAILFGSLITFIFPIIFVILTDIFTIPVEERNLEKKFGKKYLAYKKRVRRWI